MPTSGTVSTTVFQTRKVIDHAFRRCKMVPQEITQEHIVTALDLLYLYLSTLSSKGIKLWNINRILLPMYQNERSVPCPVGTVDLLNCNIRTQTRLQGVATSSEGIPENAFDGVLSTSCIQTLPNGNITLQLSSATSVFTYGVLPNVSDVWSFVIEGSNDNITYLPLITQTDLSVVAGEWLWFDVEGVNPYEYYRLRAFAGTAPTILDVAELVYQVAPQEIPLFQLNRDDYSNLPDKTSTGRPTQFWYDKQRTQPIITLWPNVEFQFTFAQLVCYIQRHVQDVGTLRDELEIPQRWYLAIVCQLAKQLAREIKEVNPAVIPIVDLDAELELNLAWAGEGDGSNAYLRPNITPYTR